MLTLGVRYLTGYAVATDVSSRERAEWPPHTARVFMALAAAWFEGGEDPGERAGLEKLESAGDPLLTLRGGACLQPGHRSNVRMYVPINDKAGDTSAMLQSAPTMPRIRQDRTMPRVHVGDGCVLFHWPEITLSEEEQEALESLLARVTRIGHSSSLVGVWMSEETPPPTFEPSDALGGRRMRTVRPGTLDLLRAAYREEERSHFTELDARIRGSKGKAKKEASAEYEAAFGQPWSSSAEAPLPQRPRIGTWRGYRCAVDAKREPPARESGFSRDLIVLAGERSPRLDLAATLQVCRAMRGALLSACREAPTWLSGHDENGDANTDGGGHLAIVPLPFVGHEHADGRLLGIGLALPHPESVDPREAARVLGPALFDPKTNEPRQLELRLGRLGVWRVRRDDEEQAPWRVNLHAETWGGGSFEGSRLWASATPVVLDRFPKTDRKADRAAWQAEAVGIVAGSCRNIGLPTPSLVDISTSSWLMGSPRALPKQRRLRGGTDEQPVADFGGGFPRFPDRRGGPRPQVHVRLEFAEPVRGPVLLGAGRFMGYGLLRPLKDEHEENQ